jgi:hypothetical protein
MQLCALLCTLALSAVTSAAPTLSLRARGDKSLNGRNYEFWSQGDGYWTCDGMSPAAQFQDRQLQIKCDDGNNRVDFYLDEGTYQVGHRLDNPHGGLVVAGDGKTLGDCTVLSDYHIVCNGLAY